MRQGQRAGRGGRHRRRGGPVAFVLVLFAAGCSFAPSPRTPAAVEALPGSYSLAGTTGGASTLRWWETFRDPVLERLVDSALVANLDLGLAIERVAEARHRYRIANAALFPTVGAAAQVSRQSTPGNTGLGGQFGGDEGDGTPPDSSPGFAFPSRFDFTTYTASLDFAYEIDFWGRARNDRGAAVREFLASRADLETARIAVIASVISTYLEAAELEARLAQATERVDLLTERVELTEERYRRGLVGSFELYTIRQAFRAAESAEPALRTAAFDANSRLALLLGRFAGPGAVGTSPMGDLHVSVEPIPADLPVALLDQRPDVRAAAERAEAARHRVGARRAELLPNLSLNASVGFQASEPADVFQSGQDFFSLLGSVFAPIFQGGRLRANVGVAEAQYRQRQLEYASAVLEAYRDVQLGLRAFDDQRDAYQAVERELEDAEASVRYQRDRFDRGIGDYVAYLDARRNLVDARSRRATARRQLAEARLAVHRALGGAWIEPEPNRVAAGGRGADDDRSR